MRAVKTEKLIKYLNVKIQGWVNYYRHCVAKATFNYLDNSIFWIVWKWAKRRHQNYLGTQKMVLLLEGESGKTRIPYSSHSGSTHEDRKRREGQGGSFAVRSRF